MSPPSEEPLPHQTEEPRLTDARTPVEVGETEASDIRELSQLPRGSQSDQKPRESPPPQPSREFGESQLPHIVQSQASTRVESRIADITRALSNEEGARIAEIPQSKSSTTQLEPRVADFIRERANKDTERALKTQETAQSKASTTQVEPRVAEFIRERANENAIAEICGSPQSSPDIQSQADSSASQIECRDRHAPIEDINTTLAKAVTVDARLLIHSQYSSHDIGKDQNPAVTRQTIRGREIFAVSQTVRDVEFVVKFSAPIELECKIVYDPVSDDCVFVNSSGPTEVQLSRCNLPYTLFVVRHNKSQQIQPGIWKVAVHKESDKRYTLLEFLLVGRSFTVSIYETNIPLSKRTADDTRKAIKRQRLENTTAEIAATQSTNSLTIELGSSHMDTASSREIVDKAAVPLLELTDREIAVIKAPHAAKSETYRLQRIKQLGTTGNTSVFSCQHSGIHKGRVVVKVLRYNGNSSFALPSFAKLWMTEMSLLEGLKHNNIVGLEAFDGRMFAIYLELLPLSLYRGLNSPFSHSDGYTILRDISSALTYLTKQGVLHNDIKPGNIAYSPQRGAVLFDFGMACKKDERPGGGTPWYLPPELIRDRSRGFPGDVWAMGITMLYVLKKMTIAEKMQKAWDIRGLHLPHQTKDGASNQMLKWLKFVAGKRAELDQSDRLENAVFQMLEAKRVLRISAAGIVAALQVSINTS